MHTPNLRPYYTTTHLLDGTKYFTLTISSGGVPKIDKIKEMACYEDNLIEPKKSQNQKAGKIPYREHSERRGSTEKKWCIYFLPELRHRSPHLHLRQDLIKRGRNLWPTQLIKCM